MLKINRSTELNIHDFIQNKEFNPFKRWRTISKTMNFGLLFGCSSGRFAEMLKNANFTEEECDDFIKLNNLSTAYNTALANVLSDKKNQKTPTDIKFLIVADAMRNSFFNTYKGLGGRIEREQIFALEHGYVRTWHGPIRRLTELRFMLRNAKGDLIGTDRFLYSKMYAHLLNQACNSTIQSMESRIAFATWVNISKYLSIWHLKSYCWNNIHDSLDFYVYKPELQIVMALANACASWERNPVKGIHMSFDGEVSDLQDEEHRNNTYYKAGVGYDPISIEEALSNYNKKNGTDLKWYGCDWLYDKYMPERKDWYDHFCEVNGKENTDRFLAEWNQNENTLRYNENDTVNIEKDA